MTHLNWPDVFGIGLGIIGFVAVVLLLGGIEIEWRRK